MAGTQEGGKKAAAKNRAKDKDFYKKIGAKGGHISRGGMFQKDREFARKWGKVGGSASRRTS